MKIKKVEVGMLQCNCYILEKNNKVLIIDPGDEPEKIKKEIGNKEIIAILITHNHFDHIGALSYFKNTPIYDYHNLEEKEYQLDDFKFDVIYTKGHSSDSVTYYFKDENIMFVGDFIFKESIGRTDLPTGNMFEMEESLSKIRKYPSKTIIYPGHGESTTLLSEIRNNPFFN